MLANAIFRAPRAAFRCAATAPIMGIGGFDEFGDAIDVVVGGNVVTPRPSSFPSSLSSPAAAANAAITPLTDISDTIFQPLELGDGIAAVLVGFALLLGPDFLLAPAGLVSDEGIRPGYTLEAVVGDIVDADAQWLKDRKENLAADAPVKVRAPIFALFIAAGLLVSRFLLVALEDSSFVTSVGIISCLGGGFLEIAREPLPTREERDLDRLLTDEFLTFSADRLVVGGRCHERDIVAAFRQYYPRYKLRDMRRSADGVSLDDDTIGDLVGPWNARMGRPGQRTSTGYWKGISVAPRDQEAPTGTA